MHAGETILRVTKQIDFRDQYRLKAGDFVTFTNTSTTTFGTWIMVLCPDGKIRPVKPDEVSEN